MALQAERLLDKFEDMERAVERDLRRAQKRLKQSIPSYLLESRPLNRAGGARHLFDDRAHRAARRLDLALPMALLSALRHRDRASAGTTSSSIVTSWPTSTASRS